MTPIDVLDGRARWALVLGDCLDPVAGLACLPDGSVEHFITDPPYSEWVHAQHKVGGGARRDGSARYKDLGFECCTADVRAAIANQAARLASRWSLTFCDAEAIMSWSDAMRASGMEHIRVGAFVKEGATPQFSGDRPAPGWEALVITHRPGRKHWNGGGRHAVWFASIAESGRWHATQKPLALMEALIRDFTSPGDLVVDPFAGSGTTGVACIRLGRRFIGWERAPKFHAAAMKRLSSTVEQPELVANEAFARTAKQKRKQEGFGF